MIEELKDMYNNDKLCRIAVYIFMVGAISAIYMFVTTYLHYMYGTKLPPASEFMIAPGTQ